MESVCVGGRGRQVRRKPTRKITSANRFEKEIRPLARLGLAQFLGAREGEGYV